MSDESVDNKTQEQRASGSEQVLGMERVSALIMRPSTHQDPNRRRRGQSTGRSPRYRLRRTRKAVPEWLALSAGPGKTRRPVVRGRGGNGAEFLDGTSVTAPPCYPAGPLHARWPEGRDAKTAAGHGISIVSSFRAAVERISTDRTLVRKEGGWEKTLIRPKPAR